MLKKSLLKRMQFHSSFSLAISLTTLAITLSACGPKSSPVPLTSPKPKSSPIELPELSQEAARDALAFETSRLDAERMSLIKTGAIPLSIDVISYSLSGRFDWMKSELYGDLAIELMILDSNGTVLALDSAVKRVDKVSVNGNEVPFEVNGELNKLLIDKSFLGIEENYTGPLRIGVSYMTQAENVTDQNPGSGSTGDFSSTLQGVGARRDDPIKSRVYYTTAEPLGASSWMPCHNSPHDRALFKTKFTMPAGERLISNGKLEQDQVLNGIRSTSYATEYSLPTYLMAFAVGEFQVTEIQRGKLPISVWSRQGLKFDSAAVLSALDSNIALIESLLVPYPFEKYALVLLPLFPSGGIEHASISFQGESRSTEGANVRDFGLSAHELAHQWFGDFVTVKTWDDLWIKEGMATLLAAEASRPYSDKNQFGTYFGPFFNFTKGEAIRDQKLKANEKYTSGPYGRSAWLFTQLRSITGDEKFWKIMRDFLNTHAFGAVGTEDMIAAFSPHLSDLQLNNLRKAIDNPFVPYFSKTEDGLVLEDPGTSLLVPLSFKRLGDSGLEKTFVLYPDSKVDPSEISYSIEDKEGKEEKSGNLISFDPQGIHPDLDFFEGAEDFLKTKKMTLAQLKLLNELGPMATLRSLENTETLDFTAGMDPSGSDSVLKETFKNLGSEPSRYLFLQRSCQFLSVYKPGEVNPDPNSLKPSLLELFSDFRYRGDSELNGSLTGCLTPNLKIAKLESLREASLNGGGDTSLSLAFSYLFLGNTPETFPLWENIAANGQSLRLKGAGIRALNFNLQSILETSAESEKPEIRKNWKPRVLRVMGSNSVTETISGVLTLAQNYSRLELNAGEDLLPGFTQLLSKNLPDRSAKQAICGAKKILTDSTMKSFLEEAKGGPNLSEVLKFESDPSYCL